MSLATELQRSVRALFDYADSLKTRITYHEGAATPSTYDFTTGAVTDSSEAHTVEDAIFVRFRDREIDGERVRPTDRRLLLSKTDLPVDMGEPTAEDWLFEGTQRWNVIDVRTEPSGSVYILHVRTAA